MIRILELWSLAVCECGYIYYEAAFTTLTVQVSVASDRGTAVPRWSRRSGVADCEVYI